MSRDQRQALLLGELVPQGPNSPWTSSSARWAHTSPLTLVVPAVLVGPVPEGRPREDGTVPADAGRSMRSAQPAVQRRAAGCLPRVVEAVLGLRRPRLLQGVQAAVEEG